MTPWAKTWAWCFTALVLVTVQGCNGGGGGKKGTPRVTDATFRDKAARGVLDEDTIVVTFSQDVWIRNWGKPLANEVFELSYDDFGSAHVESGPNPNEITIHTRSDLVFEPEGTYDPLAPPSPSPPPSGIRVKDGQSHLVFGKQGKPVRSLDYVDIYGILEIGEWRMVSSVMHDARFGHTATLLPNGEILIVGGYSDVDYSHPVGACVRGAHASIEVFDPETETFTLASGQLLEARGGHKAISTPGLDGIQDTNDDYVVILGGWAPFKVGANGGPQSTSAVEVIVPDPDGDGDTSDLVVNPEDDWATGGAVVPASKPVAELPLDWRIDDGTCQNPSVLVPFSPGINIFDAQWVPDWQFLSSPGGGNNEIFMQGGVTGQYWNLCRSAGPQPGAFVVQEPGPGPGCADNGFPMVAIDPDNDGDFFNDSRYDWVFSPSGPFLTPHSFHRWSYAQTRIPGLDGVDGTIDDVQVLYGGWGWDIAWDCAGDWTGNHLGNLEFWNPVTGPIYTGVSEGYAGCSQGAGCSNTDCSTPGMDRSPVRASHQAVALGNGSQEVLFAGGVSYSLSSGADHCARAPDVMTPNFKTPSASTIEIAGGLDPVEIRLGHIHLGLLTGSRNALLLGGQDIVQSRSSDSAAYIQPAYGITSPVDPMWEARDWGAIVSYPGGQRGVGRDRVYIFGGRSDVNGGYWQCQSVLPATISDTAEYFEEFN